MNTQVEAFARAELGMTRAVSRADRVEPGWSDYALHLVRSYASRHDQFLAEDVIAYSKGLIAGPPDGRAWGAVFQKAARRGLIRKVGYAPANSSNRSPKTLWGRADGFVSGTDS